MIKRLTCISCPNGCNLLIDTNTNNVTGNSCNIGVKYALNEINNPVRTITSTVKIKNAMYEVLPVKTKDPISKNLIFNVMEILNNTIVYAPIKVGEIIIENILDTGINIVATRSLERV